MKEILKKEQELNQLNKEIEESLQRLEENNSYENYEKHKELLERRKQSFKELNDMYRNKWEELKLPIIDDSDPVMKEFVQKEEAKFEKTLGFGGTREFLEKKIHEQRNVQAAPGDATHSDKVGEVFEES